MIEENNKQQPKYGDRFWHEEFSEYCWYVKTMSDGNYIVCLNPRLRDDDDYYSYDPKELVRR